MAEGGQDGGIATAALEYGDPETLFADGVAVGEGANTHTR